MLGPIQIRQVVSLIRASGDAASCLPRSRHAREGGVEPSGVFGVDIDEAAFAFATELADRGLAQSNVIQRDFFDVSADNLGGRFSAVVGNPPYIRHHWLSEGQKASARRAAMTAGVSLPLTADAWAYFVVHATSFLSKGGRLSFLVPVSIIHARYAEPVLLKLRDSFAEVRLIKLAERLFAGTQVQSVIVACAGYGHGPGSIMVTDVKAVAGLRGALERPLDLVDLDNRKGWSLQSLSRYERSTWTDVAGSDNVVSLGSVADIRIGVVTGANRFFVQPAKVTQTLIGPGCHAIGVVERASDLGIAVLHEMDLSRPSIGQGSRRLLAISQGFGELRLPLQKMISQAEVDGLHLRSHTARRAVWYQLVDTAIPDAFLPYMASAPQPITLNNAGATSTNGVHRLWWRSNDTEIEDAVAGTWTSLFRLGAELVGRHYGGGVLKLEPADARCLLIPVVDGAGGFLPQLDSMVRQHGILAALEFADDLILHRGLGVDTPTLGLLRSAAKSLAIKRRAS